MRSPAMSGMLIDAGTHSWVSSSDLNIALDQAEADIAETEARTYIGDARMTQIAAVIYAPFHSDHLLSTVYVSTCK